MSASAGSSKILVGRHADIIKISSDKQRKNNFSGKFKEVCALKRLMRATFHVLASQSNVLQENKLNRSPNHFKPEGHHQSHKCLACQSVRLRSASVIPNCLCLAEIHRATKVQNGERGGHEILLAY